MITHTLRDNQSKDLADKLENLLQTVTETEKHQVGTKLLLRLKRCNPNPGQTWSQLNLSEEEEELFSILCKLTWKQSEPKVDPEEGPD